MNKHFLTDKLANGGMQLRKAFYFNKMVNWLL